MPKQSHAVDPQREDVGTVAAESPPAIAGPALVTIVSSAPITVVVESIGDRQRHENGRHPLEAQQTGHYVVHEGQSLRVVNG